jgi:pilus assembly protein CpaF
MYDESLRAFLKPVVGYLDDDRCTEVLINGPQDVWVEMGGRLYKTEAVFTEDGLNAAARNMAQFVGRPLTGERPRLDARLPDGSRIHVILAPIARCGTTISIRKFFPGGLTMNQLIEFGSITPEAARLIEACVLIEKNIVVSGGTGSGKTTLLNVVSQYIPNEERIITIEDSAELQLTQDHLVNLESRPPDERGKGAVTMRDLLHSSLRLRPDRIVIGEVRGGECFDLLQALNTGHGGSMTTTHANSPRETLTRLESLALLSGVELPLRAVRAQVAAAIDVVVCTSRFIDGTRKVTHVSEVLPLDDRGDYRVQDLFVYTQTGRDEEGRVEGYFAPTGVIPTFHRKLIADGFHDLDEHFFNPETYGMDPPPIFAGEATVGPAAYPPAAPSGRGVGGYPPETPAYEEGTYDEQYLAEDYGNPEDFVGEDTNPGSGA